MHWHLHLLNDRVIDGGVAGELGRVGGKIDGDIESAANEMSCDDEAVAAVVASAANDSDS